MNFYLQILIKNINKYIYKIIYNYIKIKKAIPGIIKIYNNKSI